MLMGPASDYCQHSHYKSLLVSLKVRSKLQIQILVEKNIVKHLKAHCAGCCGILSDILVHRVQVVTACDLCCRQDRR